MGHSDSYSSSRQLLIQVKLLVLYQNFTRDEVPTYITHFSKTHTIFYSLLVEGMMAEEVDGRQGEVVGTQTTLHHLEHLGTVWNRSMDHFTASIPSLIIQYCEADN